MQTATLIRDPMRRPTTGPFFLLLPSPSFSFLQDVILVLLPVAVDSTAADHFVIVHECTFFQLPASVYVLLYSVAAAAAAAVLNYQIKCGWIVNALLHSTAEPIKRCVFSLPSIYTMKGFFSSPSSSFPSPSSSSPLTQSFVYVYIERSVPSSLYSSLYSLPPPLVLLLQ